MPDKFSHHAPTLDGPARFAEAVAFDANNDLPNRPRFLIVGTAGTIVADFDNAKSITINVPAGVVPLAPTRIRSGTAASIVACW